MADRCGRDGPLMVLADRDEDLSIDASLH